MPEIKIKLLEKADVLELLRDPEIRAELASIIAETKPEYQPPTFRGKTQRNAEIIRLRYEERLTYRAIAELFGLTGQRIREICSKGNVTRIREEDKRRSEWPSVIEKKPAQVRPQPQKRLAPEDVIQLRKYEDGHFEVKLPEREWFNVPPTAGEELLKLQNNPAFLSASHDEQVAAVEDVIFVNAIEV
jgi:hypothetical protein